MDIKLKLNREYKPQDLSVKQNQDHSVDLIFNKQKIMDLTDKVPTSLFANRNEFPAVYHAKDEILEIIRFIELQGKSEYSLLDATVKIPDLINKTSLSVAVNDHGNMYSLNKFPVPMHEAGKKAILSSEIYMFSLPQTYIVQRGDTLKLVSELKHEAVEDIIKDNPQILFKDPEKTIKAATLTLNKAAEANTLPIMAKTKKGFQTLKRVVSLEQINKRITHGLPQLTWEQLKENHEDLLALSGSEDSEFYRSILKHDLKRAEKVASALKNIFGDDFYIEVFHKDEKLDKAVEDAKKIAKKLKIKTVAVDDFHMLNKGEEQEVKVAQSIKAGKTIDQNFFSLPGHNYYYHTSKEAEEEFADDTESLDNTIEVYSKIDDIDVEPHRYFAPDFVLPKGYKDQNSYFEYLAKKGFKVRMKQLNIQEGTDYYQKCVDRLHYEIKIIEKMQYAGYFLVVADYVNYARRNYESYDDATVRRWKKFMRDHDYDENKPISVGYGRGSAAGSIVCYSMAITAVPPLRYNLLFERFLNPHRVSEPDIDCDFSASGRPEVLKYVNNFYNHGDNVDWIDSRFSSIIVFGSLKGKQALRDTTRAYGQKPAVGDRLSKLFEASGAKTIKDALSDNDFYTYAHSSSVLHSIVSMAQKLEGLEKSEGIHACGKIIAPAPVSTFTPITYLKEPDGSYGIATETVHVEPLAGLLKMDFLGLKNLNVLDYAFDQINKEIDFINEKENKHLEHLNQINVVNKAVNDIPMYQFLGEGNTFGVFQLSSDGMTNLIKQMYSDVPQLPKTKQTANELAERAIAAISLYRPGPMAQIPNFIKNMHAKEIPYEFPQLKDILKDTYGIIVYQEQVMLASRKIAGFNQAQSDELRKAMGHKIPELMKEYKQYFLYGSNGKSIDGDPIPGAIAFSHLKESEALKLWNMIETFASYGFNKSHAVSYVYISLVEAYLSLHYPEEYFAAQLNNLSTDTDKISDALAHIKARKLKILPPSINESAESFAVTRTNGQKAIRFGLNGIKRSGRKAKAIIAEREKHGLFKDVINCGIRLQKAGIWNKTVYEALTYSGAFDGFPGSRAEKINKEETVLNYVKACTHKPTIFALDSQQNFIHDLLDFTDSNDSTSIDDLFKEKEYIGFFISGNPLDRYYTIVKDDPIYQNIPEARKLDNGSTFRFIGLLDEIRVIATHGGSKMAFAKFEDEFARTDTVIFPSGYEQAKNLLKKNSMVIVEGTIQERNGEKSLLISSISDIDDLLNDSDPKLVVLTLPYDKKVAKKELYQVLALPINRESKNIPLHFKLGINTAKEYNYTGGKLLRLSYDLATILKVQTLIGRTRITFRYQNQNE